MFALWPYQAGATFDLNDGGGFCEPGATGTLPYNETIKSHKAKNLAARPGDRRAGWHIGQDTERHWGKRDRDPEEKLKLKKIVSVMKGFGFAVAIDTSWPFRSESAAESTHYSGTPRQVNTAQKSMVRRWVGSYAEHWKNSLLEERAKLHARG